MSIAKTAPVANKPLKQPMDKLLFLLTLMLIGIGIVTVFDSSYVLALESRHGDEFYFLSRQVKFAVIGMIVLLITMRVPYWRWRKYAFAGVALCVILLIAVFIPHVGMSLNGSRRWLGHGSIAFQPSELAKIAMILYLAHITVVRPNMLRRFKEGLLPPLFVLLLVTLLIAKEDLGTGIVLCGTGLVMLFIAGARRRHMGLLLFGVTIVGAIYAVSKPYRLHRLTAFMDPKADQFGTGYQVWHALIGLGSGGATGLGLGEGREKLFIPMANTDFIFAVIAEEWGLIGTITLVIVFLMVAARGYAIAHNTKDPFGAMLASGITTLITIQALLNIAVATSSIPNTGVPLPFISYGGSSLILTMAALGLLLNISRYPEGKGLPGARNRVTTSERDFERRWDRGAVYLPGKDLRTRPAASGLKRVDRTKDRDLRISRD